MKLNELAVNVIVIDFQSQRVQIIAIIFCRKSYLSKGKECKCMNGSNYVLIKLHLMMFNLHKNAAVKVGELYAAE